MFVDKDYMVRIRRELHQVPEIGFDLPKSLAIIRRELANIGLPYREDVGRSCIIATLNEGVGSQTIAFRADFDGLPIEEKKHVGLRNIRGRLKAMVNGDLILESKLNVGTKAVIMIPKEVTV